MSATARIATLTLNPALDVCADVDALVPERKLRCRNPRRDPGGGGINVSRVLHRLAEAAPAVFPCGGSAGARLCALLDAEGVPTRPVPIAGDTREDFTARELTTGRQYRFVMPGPPLAAAEQESVLAQLDVMPPDLSVLVVSGSLPPNVSPQVCGRLAQWARRRGARLALDASGPALRAGLDAGVWLIKPNLAELEELARRPLPDMTARLDACRALIAAGRAAIVALSLGSEGALLVEAGAVRKAEPLAIAPLSAVGAGDSFLAALVRSLVAGETPDEALGWASAAAAAALLTPGSGLGSLQDILRLRPQVRVRGIEEANTLSAP